MLIAWGNCFANLLRTLPINFENYVSALIAFVGDFGFGGAIAFVEHICLFQKFGIFDHLRKQLVADEVVVFTINLTASGGSSGVAYRYYKLFIGSERRINDGCFAGT